MGERVMLISLLIKFTYGSAVSFPRVSFFEFRNGNFTITDNGKDTVWRISEIASIELL